MIHPLLKLSQHLISETRGRPNMGTDFMKLLIVAHLSTYAVPEDPRLICPDVVEVNTSTTLICSFSVPKTIYYDSPQQSDVAFCLEKQRTCVSKNSRYHLSKSTTYNLDIKRVKISDEGDWKCKDVNEAKNVKCPLVVMKTPSCDINSGRDTRDIPVNTEIPVIIKDYYCSLPADFLLHTGNTTEELVKNHTVTTKKTAVFNTTLNVTRSHFGPVKLLFICNNVTKTVPCGDIELEQDKMTSINANRGIATTSTLALISIIPIVIIVTAIIIWRVRSNSNVMTREIGPSTSNTDLPMELNPVYHSYWSNQTNRTGQSEEKHVTCSENFHKELNKNGNVIENSDVEDEHVYFSLEVSDKQLSA